MGSGFYLLGATSTSALTFSSDVDISFTFNPTISLSLSSSDLVIANLAPGSAADSNEITVTVSTNTAYGYTLNATVGQQTNYETRNLILDGYSGSSSDPIFTSLAYGDSESTLATDNTWGYAFKTSTANAPWSNYSGLPLYSDSNNVTELIDTDGAAASDYVTFKIGARAASTQAGGEYKNVINFIAVAKPEPHLEPVPCQGGYICYNVNSLDPTEGTMGRQEATDGNTATLFASNFSRDGYGFAGWSDAYDYETNPNAHFYGPNENITVPAGTTANGLALYAVWVQSAGTMQANTSSVCNSLTPATYSDEGDQDESTWSITANLSSISALTDTRDNQTYAIAKLTDGNCWMIENLRLADTHQEGANTVSTTLTTTNTNNPLNDNDPTNPTVTLKHNYSDATTYPTLSATSSDATSWCQTNSADCDDQSRLRTDNTASRVSYTSDQIMSPNSNFYSYGNYYNWYSASAGRGTYSMSGGNTAGDLCPTGWHLPTGAGDGEFGVLSNSLGGLQSNGVAQKMSNSTSPTYAIMRKRLLHFPNNLFNSGFIYDASFYFRGSSGSYWSSTSLNNNYAYGLYFRPSTFDPGTDNVSNKYYGRTVRCIANS